MNSIEKDLRERDAIDFARTKVSKLFRRMLWPTLVGMVSLVLLNVTDGAFVGHGVGSEAIAAINIVAPIFLLTSGLGLTFGIGSSVVASIHLSQQRNKAANINITQAVAGGLLLSAALSAVMVAWPERVCRLFGASDALVPLAAPYMFWIALLSPFNMLATLGLFIVRLDGSPRYAMCCELLPVGLNIVLDWLFIFPLGMGIAGAAIATSVSFTCSGLMVLLYLLRFSRTLHFHRLRATWKSLRLTLRNIGYQLRIGFSAFLGDAGIAMVMVAGNYVFIHYLGEDGVAAWGVACYCFPIVFNVGNAVVQSAQPIISFGHGTHDSQRVRQALRLAAVSALLIGVGGTALLGLGADAIAATFLDPACGAHRLACQGLPVFGLSFVCIALNLVAVGYYQSVEQAGRATAFTLLRCFVFVVAGFLTLPRLMGVQGIWLCIPVAESLTLAVIAAAAFAVRRRARRAAV